MTTYTADISWTLGSGENFLKGRYSRGHTISFDGGTIVPASPSVPMMMRHLPPGSLDPKARKDFLIHAHATHTE